MVPQHELVPVMRGWKGEAEGEIKGVDRGATRDVGHRFGGNEIVVFVSKREDFLRYERWSVEEDEGRSSVGGEESNQREVE